MKNYDPCLCKQSPGDLCSQQEPLITLRLEAGWEGGSSLSPAFMNRREHGVSVGVKEKGLLTVWNSGYAGESTSSK